MPAVSVSPLTLGCCPLPGGKKKGRGRGRDRRHQLLLKGQEPWLLGGLLGGGMSRSVKGHFPEWGVYFYEEGDEGSRRIPQTDG